MTIDASQVEAIAALAALDVPADELAAVARQLDRIIAYVEQLGELPATAGDRALVLGPAHAPLRSDVVVPAHVAESLPEIAPAFSLGLFMVPPRGTLDSE